MDYDWTAEVAKARAYLAPPPARFALGGSFNPARPLWFGERRSPDAVMARWRELGAERDRVAEDALTTPPAAPPFRYAAGGRVPADSLAVQIAKARAYLA